MISTATFWSKYFQIAGDKILELIFPAEFSTSDFDNYVVNDRTRDYQKDCPFLDKVLVLVDYSKVETPIFNFKYKHQSYLSSVFGKSMAKHLKSFESYSKNETPNVITFCPADPIRYKVRGYNPAELITRQLGHELNLTTLDIFVKIKSSQSQTQLSREERMTDKSELFKIKLDYQNHRILNSCSKIIIFDDVITTGSTLNALASVLKANYPKLQVWALAFAGNPKPK
ncbi:MAG: ComF family protein [Patescibacteria group bacterium]